MLLFFRIFLINLLMPLIVSHQPLCAEEQPLLISFFDLDDTVFSNDQLITIRGFLYESPESQLILAAEPNLKTCCVGSASKRQKQLLVTGDIAPALTRSSAVTLQGNLVIALEDNFPFRLENSLIVPQKDQYYLMLGLVGLGLTLLSGGTFFLLRKKQDP